MRIQIHDLPGVTTTYMLEAIVDGYESALGHGFDEPKDAPEPPDAVRLVIKRAAKRMWKELARIVVDSHFGRRLRPLKTSDIN